MRTDVLAMAARSQDRSPAVPPRSGPHRARARSLEQGAGRAAPWKVPGRVAGVCPGYRGRWYAAFRVAPPDRRAQLRAPRGPVARSNAGLAELYRRRWYLPAG